MMSQDTNQLAAALAKAQGQMRNATLNRFNPHYKSKYADLAGIIDAVRIPLSENGLAVTQTTDFVGDKLVLVTTLLHTSGQYITSLYPLPIGKPQEMGSALTYARRYTASAIVFISADDDDDAEAAQKTNGKAAVDHANTATVSEMQQIILNKLIAETRTDTPKFCQAMGVEKVSDITVAEYDIAVAKLNKKKAQMEAASGTGQ